MIIIFNLIARWRRWFNNPKKLWAVFKTNRQGGLARANNVELGRSMVEMLGVLAIVGVLSVGAIAGYSKAMFKYKLNKQTEQLNTVFNSVARHASDFKNLDSSQIVISYFIAMGEIPTEMIKKGNNRRIYDIFNQEISIKSQPANGSASGEIPGVTVLYYPLTLSAKSRENIEICKNIFLVAQENHANLYQIYTASGQTASDKKSFVAYGDNYCKAPQVCLKDLTLEKVYQFCRNHIAQENNNGQITALWKHI